VAAAKRRLRNPVRLVGRPLPSRSSGVPSSGIVTNELEQHLYLSRRHIDFLKSTPVGRVV
jgi:hypothetical protein